jgi:hypothetical protein
MEIHVIRMRLPVCVKSHVKVFFSSFQQVFKFGTPYAKMYESLSATPEEEAFFSRNGVLQLCRRGAAVKV